MKLDINYIAGFIDGEGCIAVYRLKDIRLVATNTNLEILTEIRDYFGAGKIRQKSRGPKDKFNKIAYIWEVWGRQTEKVLAELLPHLRQKKEQARLALEFCKLMRPPGASIKWSNHALTSEEKQKRLVLQDQIKELKKCA